MTDATRRTRIAIPLAAALIIGVSLWALPSGITDALSHPPPTTGTYAYSTFRPSGAGVTYVDPVFGTTVRRLTADGQDDDLYARNMWWNADATKYDHRGKIIDTTTGAVTHTVPLGTYDYDAGFDPVDPTVFYYINGSTIHKVVLGSGGNTTDTVWLTTPAAINSQGGSENWISADGRVIAVSYGSEPSVHVYDTANLAAGPFTGAVPLGDSSGYSAMLPSGRYLVTTTAPGYQGNGATTTFKSYAINLAARTLSTTGNAFWNLCGDHGVFISPSDGKDYMISADCYNYYDIVRIDVTGSTGTETQQLSSNKVLLQNFDWNFSYHLTAVAKGALRDWAFMDSEGGSNTPSSFGPYQSEIIGLNVLTGEVRRLAHHRSNLTDYYAQPRVSASWGGELVGWASNFQQSSVDVYALTFGGLGAGSSGDTTPPTVSMTAPAANAALTGTATVSATASDDTGVVGVQFKANGTNIGSEVTAAPYSLSWNSASVADGAYTITATARDAAGNSTTSAGVAVTVANTAPAISAVAAGSVTATGATITWTTNQAANSQVDYGTTSTYGTSTAVNGTLATSHSQALTGLASATTYHYRVRSTNAQSQTSTSADNTFTTVGPPVISGIGTSSTSGTSATIVWTTDQAADTQVDYGLTTAYGTTTTLVATLVTSHSQALSGLTSNTTYHYRVRSTNTYGLQSVSGDNTFVAVAPPAISAVAASSITGTGATIGWTTDQASDSQVDYGLTTAYGTSTTLNASLVTTHSQTLSGLTAGTAYHFRVKSRNSAGGLATSPDATFTTVAAPSISAVAASNVSGTTATVTWSTNQAADSQVAYGTTTAYGATTTLDGTLVTSHSQGLSGLTPATTYHYRVSSRNAVGLLSSSTDGTFTTAAAPTISSVSASGLTGTSATITWTTNQSADSQVDYGTTTAYGASTTLNASLTTAHSQALSGLTSGTMYHYRVKSRNAQSLLATSGDFVFTTVAPTAISAVSASGITSTGATITWTTNQAADSQVDYGTTTGYGASTSLDGLLVTSHGQSLAGLSPATKYHYRVKSKNSSGLLSTSADFTLTTANSPSDSYSVTVCVTGSGAVVAPLAGISCGSACTGSVPSGTTVVLTAMPGAASAFGGWGGACDGRALTCTVMVEAATTVTATFTQATTGDFDGDGFADLIWQNDDGTLALWTMQGNTRVSASYITPMVSTSGGDWQIVDPTGGSGSDAGSTGTDGGTGGGLPGFSHVTTGGLLSAVYLTPQSRIIDLDWRIVATPDLNGDGKADVLWQNAVTGKLAAWIMNGPVKIAGSFLTPDSVDPASSWQIVGTGDFNGDGKADIVWQQLATGLLNVWFMDGTTKIGEQALTPATVPTDWRMVGAADFDADGQVDLVWQSQTTGDVYVWLMNGLSMRVQQPIGQAGGPGWQVRAVGDFDGDGQPDLIWENAAGDLVVWFMNGTVVKSSASLAPGSIDPSWKIMGVK